MITFTREYVKILKPKDYGLGKKVRPLPYVGFPIYATDSNKKNIID